jgi:hypothetical protein
VIYLDACVFTPHTRAWVIAHKLEDAKVIFRDKIKYPYSKLDDGIRAACVATQGTRPRASADADDGPSGFRGRDCAASRSRYKRDCCAGHGHVGAEAGLGRR